MLGLDFNFRVALWLCLFLTFEKSFPKLDVFRNLRFCLNKGNNFVYRFFSKPILDFIYLAMLRFSHFNRFRFRFFQSS